MRPDAFDMTAEQYEAFVDEMRPYATVENFMVLLNAITFYADPETYRNVALIESANPGAFADDFTEIKLIDDGIVISEDEHPGAMARYALHDIFLEELE